MKKTAVIIANYRRQLSDIVDNLHEDLPPAAFVHLKNKFGTGFTKRCLILEPLIEFLSNLEEDEKTLKSKE